MRIVVLTLALAVFALPSSAGADGAVLTGVTGPGDAITLTGPDGSAVTHLEPGTYTVQVEDTSNRRDFTLRGPGVIVHSGFEFAGRRSWTVTFTDGWYRYYDAAFEGQFHGQFTVGSPPPATLTARITDTRISFTDASGAPVRRLDPGIYSIAVRDTSSLQNFRLMGAGVEEHTQVLPVVDTTWTVTLADGRYSFFSERRPERLRGSFVVGTPPPLSTAKVLHVSLGPDFAVGIVNQNWQPFRLLRPGTYTLEIDDTTEDHNFHLMGPRVMRSTTLPFVGHATWRVRLRVGFYLFRCDPHDIMIGDFRVKAKPKPRRR